LFGCEDRTISILKNYKEIEHINGHNHSVRTLCKIDDNYFASGSFDKKIKFWDINTKNNIYTLEGHTGNVICIIKLKDNKLVSCSSDKTIIIWD
jgi:WD40 repeat protein